MDWTKIAGPLIGAGATVLGTVIGGPAGGVIGKTVGGVLSGALGVPNEPDAVAAAVEKDPGGAAAALDANKDDIAKAIAEANAEIVKTVNETYRLELKSEDWYVRGWRPFVGWGFGIVWLLHGLAIGKALWMKEFDIVRQIPDLTVFYSAAAAVVGVYAWQRSQEKIKGASDQIGGLIGALAEKGLKAVRK